MDNNKKNCAECDFYGELNHREKKIYCILKDKWRGQYDACEFWTEYTNRPKHEKLESAKQIKHQIRDKKNKKRHEEDKKEARNKHEEQLKQQNKLNWRGIIFCIITAILGFILGRLF